MDTSTGRMYPSKEAALADGADPAKMIQLRRITKGPFKGRVYEELPGGGLGQRRPDIEARERRAAANEARLEELLARERQVKRKRPTMLREMTAEEIRDEVTRNPREGEHAETAQD